MKDNMTNESILARILGSIAFVLSFIGIAGMDSDNLVIPIAVSTIGLVFWILYAIETGYFRKRK